MINNKLVDNLILSLNQEINVYKHLLNKELEKREEVDLGQMFDSNGDEVVNVETYHIDLEIEYLKGSIGVSQHIMQLIKENTDNL
tara:strand:- start:47 stop:301 length:255 start_codon:yes stop_codon:yes gene_type:complete